jgi:hypothetical protein
VEAEVSSEEVDYGGTSVESGFNLGTVDELNDDSGRRAARRVRTEGCRGWRATRRAGELGSGKATGWARPNVA